MSPTVTVAIPFFNEETHLAGAIRSILRQRCADFELLLIDDGSTDGSLAIARSFSTDPRVIVHADGHRKRLATRLNETVAAARGRWVARMDADDISHPARLERQLALLERSAADAAGTWCVLLDENEHIRCVAEGGALPATGRGALERGLLIHASMMARRDWLATHPYDESLTRTEDRDLWCRTYGSGRFAAVPEVLYAVRVAASDPSFVPLYIETHRQNRLLFRHYGPAIYGWPRTLAACSASVLKSAVVRGAARVGLLDSLVRRRGRNATLAELALVREILAAQRA